MAAGLEVGYWMKRQIPWLLIVLLEAGLRMSAGAASPEARWKNDLERANKLRTQGRTIEAVKLYTAAVKEAERFGPNDRRLATSLNNLGVLSMFQGRPAQAEPLLKRALKIRKKALGPGHPAVAQSLNNLAAFYNDQGKEPAADALYRQALAIEEKALREARPGVGDTLAHLAEIYTEKGQSVEAEPLMWRALAIAKRAPAGGSTGVVASRRNYALLLKAAGRDAEAKKIEAQAGSTAVR